MGVGLSGNLRDFGIADVFQLIGQQRKTGVLELRSGTSRAELVFDRGLVVSAAPATGRSSDLDPVADRMVRCGLLVRGRAEDATAASRASAQSVAATVVERGWVRPEEAEEATDLVNRDTIFEVLRWTDGSFDFRARDVSHSREPADLLGAEQILMDGLRMVDEWQSFAVQVPTEDTVFECVDAFESFAESHPEATEAELARAERVYLRVDGRLSARRVIDLARLGTFDGTRCLAELRRADVIRPRLASSRERIGAYVRASRSHGVSLQRAVATLAPLLALAVVAYWTASAPGAAEAPAQGFRIERPDLDGLRQAYATRAIENAIEAYRLERGEWPGRLADLERAGLIGAGQLAAPEGRPYYSRHREQGLVFLAPER